MKRLHAAGICDCCDAPELLEEADAQAARYEATIRQLETTLAHAEAFIEHMEMGYRWAEWCEGRNP